MIPGSGGFLGSYNQDVLTAEVFYSSSPYLAAFVLIVCVPLYYYLVQPKDEESRVKLVEEIKNRAKGCVSGRNYPEAINLYTKGIELTASDASAQSILYANRSMCELNMNRAAGAIKDAEEAIKLDANYIKGYYRKAMGHSQISQWKEAKQALQAGLTLKPDDKELSAQLIKVEDKLRNESATPAVPAATNRVPVSHNNTSSTIPSASSTPSSSSKSNKSSATTPSTSSKAPSSTPAEKTEEDEEDLKSLNLRGYKKTADGRVTTFFNNELDAKTKELIGNIAPKKLDATGEVITAAASNGVGSAWNAAGTYEEKILTPWATEYLRTVFATGKITIDQNKIHPVLRTVHPDILSIIVELTSVESITGDAQVTMLRGKRKHVCDYTIVVKWNVLLTFEDTSPKVPVQINGLITIQDITADSEYEIDHLQVTHLNDAACTYHSLPREYVEAINKYVKASDNGLQKHIHNVLTTFWTELKSK